MKIPKLHIISLTVLGLSLATFFCGNTLLACIMRGKIVNNSKIPLLIGAKVIQGGTYLDNQLVPLPDVMPLSSKGGSVTFKQTTSGGVGEGGVGMSISKSTTPCMEVGWGMHTDPINPSGCVGLGTK